MEDTIEGTSIEALRRQIADVDRQREELKQKRSAALDARARPLGRIFPDFPERGAEEALLQKWSDLNVQLGRTPGATFDERLFSMRADLHVIAIDFTRDDASKMIAAEFVNLIEALLYKEQAEIPARLADHLAERIELLKQSLKPVVP